MATQTRPFLKVRLLLLVAIVFGLHTRADAIDSLEWGPLPDPYPAPDWSVQSFAEAGGMKHRVVYSISIETNQTVWVGTSDGLFRYDGYFWQRYSTCEGLPSDAVRCVMVARNGDVWIGTDRGAGVFKNSGFDFHGSQAGLAGPSVRRIAEGQDGSIWFASDHWPDQTHPAGVSRWYNNSWTHWGIADGLPSDHVFFILPKGGESAWASTDRGVAELKDGKWSALSRPRPEFDNGSPWSLAQGKDGRVFGAMTTFDSYVWFQSGQTGYGPLKFRDRNGRVTVGFPELNFSVLVAASSNKEIYALVRTPEGTVITHFNDGFFRQISPVVAPNWLWPEDFQIAPDGSMWIVGDHFLQRWQPGGQAWHLIPGLPDPRLVDGKGRIWLGNDRNTAVIDGNRVARLKSPWNELHRDVEGNVWGIGLNGRVWSSLFPENPVTENQTGISRIQRFQTDSRGRVWIGGPSKSNDYSLAIFGDGNWQPVDLTELGRWRVQNYVPGRAGAMWCLLHQANQFAIGHVDGQKAKVYALPPSLWLEPPFLAADAEDTVWLGGVSTLHRWRPEIQVPELQTDFRWHASFVIPHPKWLGFGLESRGGGQTGYGYRIDGKWRTVPADWDEDPGSLPDFADRQAPGGPIHLLLGRGIAKIFPEFPFDPRKISMPTGIVARSVVSGRGDELWVGTSGGTLHYTPQTRAPRLWNVSVEGTVRQDARLRIEASAVEWQLPAGTPRHYRFAWRFDDAEWTAPQILPKDGLPLNGLRPGEHSLSLRAIDEDGNLEQEPQVFSVRVQSIPIEERAWFIPTLLLTVVAFGLISGMALHARHRLIRQTKGLEETVQIRTHELRLKASEAESLAFAADAASRAKSEFLAAASHELRTPMNGFLGFGQLLCGTRLDSQQRYYCDLIMSCGQELMRTVHRILEFDNLHRAAPSHDWRPFNPRKILKDAVDSLLPVAQMKGLKLEIDAATDAPAEFHGDPARFRQILHHLLDNGIKFTASGGVTVRLTREQSDELRVAVVDTGIGIPSEKQSLIFKPFTVVDGSTTRQTGGLGLGLVTSRKLVMDMGGAIGFESVKGQGSVFWFTIPMAEKNHPPSNRLAPSAEPTTNVSGDAEHRFPRGENLAQGLRELRGATKDPRRQN